MIGWIYLKPHKKNWSLKAFTHFNQMKPFIKFESSVLGTHVYHGI